MFLRNVKYAYNNVNDDSALNVNLHNYTGWAVETGSYLKVRNSCIGYDDAER